MIRSILSRVLDAEPDIQVVPGASDPYEARDRILAHRPDVIILDNEMPRMDGLTFLKKLMVHYPVPVIMCSSIAPASSRFALTAIEYGAIDVATKPDQGGREALRALASDLVAKVRASVSAIPSPAPTRPAHRVSSFESAGLDPHRYVVALGASTGGTNAIREVLAHVPPDFPPILMVQHMPEGFTRSFAERLDRLSPITVREAVEGDLIQPGYAFLARGGVQMTVLGSSRHWRITYGTTQPVNHHCPSVDVLFESVAQQRGRQLIGILLTGMGADGAKGLLSLRHRGALTIAQERMSCVVYGMPKVAVDLGAARHQARPEEIGNLIVRTLCKDATTKRQRQSVS